MTTIFVYIQNIRCRNFVYYMLYLLAIPFKGPAMLQTGLQSHTLLLNFHKVFLSGRTHCRIRHPKSAFSPTCTWNCLPGSDISSFISQYFPIFRVRLALSSSDQTGFPIILSEFQSRTPWEETENVRDCKVKVDKCVIRQPLGVHLYVRQAPLPAATIVSNLSLLRSRQMLLQQEELWRPWTRRQAPSPCAPLQILLVNLGWMTGGQTSWPERRQKVWHSQIWWRRRERKSRVHCPAVWRLSRFLMFVWILLVWHNKPVVNSIISWQIRPHCSLGPDLGPKSVVIVWWTFDKKQFTNKQIPHVKSRG